VGKLPASLFYWGDFIRDPDLRRCSNAAVGVWIRCLCLMFECEPKGVLATNGQPWSDEDICLAVGGRWEETNACLTELVTKGVASRNASGALMNRRMYRDEKIRDDTRKRVRAFRERQECNAESNGPSNADVRECTETETEVLETEVSEGSSEKPSTKRETKAEIAEQEEAIYQAYPRHVGKESALKAIRKAVERVSAGNASTAAMSEHDARRWLWKRAVEYARSREGQKPAGDEDYRPHPATWFDKGRYLDETSEWNRTAGGNGHVNGNGKVSAEEHNFAFLRGIVPDADAPDRSADSGGHGKAPDGERAQAQRVDLSNLGRTIDPVRS
jgi:hypothetical protein